MEKYELIDARSNRKLYLEIFDEYYRELLEEDPTLNEYSSKECALENLDSTTDSPYFIMVNNSLAGLVVFSIEEENVNDDECHSYLNEIYVKKEYRNKGIATSIAINYFNSLKYDSGLCYLRKSKNEQFWKKTIKNYHFSYKIYKKKQH